MKVSHAIGQILKKEGIQFITGYPVNHIFEGAAAADIRTIVVRQERTGLHMADAVSRTTSGDQVGVFIMQHGPGSENAFGGVAQAYGDSVPLVVIPMGFPRSIQNISPNFSSFLNFQHVTKWVEQVVLPEQVNKPYAAPKMVIYSGATRSRCGGARSQMGPFYCPIDQTVYIDLSFFQEMQRKFRAGGDFAYAYVIAHEVGHHVQNQLGLLQRAQARQREIGEPEANQISVRVELMADCLAGVWAKNSDQKYHFLEEGDVEQAMKAAEAIGDDRLQKQAQGYAVPDSFTHGSSAQRVRWFMNGLKNGQVQQCDTFRAARL